MFFKSSNYEALLSNYSNRDGAITLLKQHRPYLEMIPSLRRPSDSLITIPLPIVKLHNSKNLNHSPDIVRLPCELALLMCDPEWKIKMGVEIIVFIHRPDEDFSHLLGRWRETQIFLNTNYEWLMPISDEHIFSEAAEKIYPLFVLFAETPLRIKRGLEGAHLPFIIQTISVSEQLESEIFS